MSKKFNFKCYPVWFVLVLFLCFRLFLAYQFPVTNDEAYYWDWSRDLQLSYIDAPPFVAWLAYVGTHFFAGAFGARFCIPFLHFFSVIFLLLSLGLLFKNKSEFKVKHALALCLLTEIIPYFSLSGFMLLPDASLLFSISGCLYFVLKSFISFRESIAGFTPQNDRSEIKSLQYGAFFGFFLGLGFLSKYQIVPISLGFFIAFIVINGFSNIKFQIKYWLIVLLIFAIVSSPVFIWNFQNNWASFRFQTNHGFDSFQFQAIPLLRYLLGVSLFLFPWYFYLFLKLIFKFSNQHSSYEKIELFFILPFVFLFVLIFISALGKQSLPHWALPGFFILTPLLAKNLFLLTRSNRKFWLKMHGISIILTISLGLLTCVGFVQTSILNNLKKFKMQITDVEKIFLWPKLQQLLKNETSIDIQTFPYYEAQQCPQNTPYIASLNWYWTAQIAFHFKDQPRVFDFTEKQAYYTWRDDISQFAGCRFIVLGGASSFEQKRLRKIMDIESVNYVTLKDYIFTKMVVVHGKIKTRPIRTIVQDNQS